MGLFEQVDLHWRTVYNWSDINIPAIDEKGKPNDQNFELDVFDTFPYGNDFRILQLDEYGLRSLIVLKIHFLLPNSKGLDQGGSENGHKKTAPR